jgi:O-6-methylguanine DNA methyltransferase
MVEKVVRSIPRGSVMTYGEVAYKAGRPGAARAVGTIMSKNDDVTVPCHRVIRADGKIGGYNGLRGGRTKAELLRREGYRG